MSPKPQRPTAPTTTAPTTFPFPLSNAVFPDEPERTTN